MNDQERWDMLTYGSVAVSFVGTYYLFAPFAAPYIPGAMSLETKKLLLSGASAAATYYVQFSRTNN